MRSIPGAGDGLEAQSRAHRHEVRPRPASPVPGDRSASGRVPSLGYVRTSYERRERLKAVYQEASGCLRCPELAATRRTVVFGSGNAAAELMFVGEAPGKNEDEQGLPFVGQAGRLLSTLLEEIGLQRSDVFITNVLRCRPPGNRDPLPQEILNCQDYLFRTLEAVEPRVVCTLGNFATKLLRSEPVGITRLHGRPEVRTIGPRAVRLFPLFHPAAALYTPAMLATLREDFSRIPELLAMAPPAEAGHVPDRPEAEPPSGDPLEPDGSVPDVPAPADGVPRTRSDEGDLRLF